MVRCKAAESNPIDGPAANIEDTGPLTKKRMETIDDETSAAAVDFIQRQSKAGKPFFCWFNGTRMHLRTHVKADHRSPPGLTARTEYADGMVEHDGHVGQILKTIDDLGIGDDTIVLYTTDNGPHANSWPDGAITPFRSEKNTNWEGAFRVPCMIRWPGKIKAGSVSNEIVSGLDWLPTFLAVAGDADIKEKLLGGHAADGKTFKVHLDGYNQLAYLTGQTDKSPRKSTSTSATTATCWQCGTRTGKSSSLNSGCRARCESGPSRLSCSGCRSSSTSVPTPTNGRISPQILTTTGSCLSRMSSSPARKRSQVPGDFQGLPVPSTGGVIHNRPGHGEHEAPHRRSVAEWTGRQLSFLSPASGAGKPICDGNWMTAIRNRVKRSTIAIPGKLGSPEAIAGVATRSEQCGSHRLPEIARRRSQLDSCFAEWGTQQHASNKGATLDFLNPRIRSPVAVRSYRNGSLDPLILVTKISAGHGEHHEKEGAAAVPPHPQGRRTSDAPSTFFAGVCREPPGPAP